MRKSHLWLFAVALVLLAAPMVRAQEAATESPTTPPKKRKAKPLIPSREIKWRTSLQKELKHADGPKPVIVYFTYDT